MRKLTIWLTIVVAFIAGYVAGSLEPTTNAEIGNPSPQYTQQLIYSQLTNIAFKLDSIESGVSSIDSCIGARSLVSG